MAIATEAKNIEFMELRLDPVVPMLIRGKDGRMRFNKGYHSPNKGKTYAEIFGEERAREILRKRSEKQKWHKNYNVNNICHSKPCVAIHEGRLVARFHTCKDAAKAVGVSYTGICRWLKGINKPKNGWQWFYEDESWKWGRLITNR